MVFNLTEVWILDDNGDITVYAVEGVAEEAFEALVEERDYRYVDRSSDGSRIAWRGSKGDLQVYRRDVAGGGA